MTSCARIHKKKTVGRFKLSIGQLKKVAQKENFCLTVFFLSDILFSMVAIYHDKLLIY